MQSARASMVETPLFSGGYHRNFGSNRTNRSHFKPGTPYRLRTTGLLTGRSRYTVSKRKRGYLRTGGYYGFPTGGELKFIDAFLGATNCVTGGTVFGIMPAIAIGTGENDRIGRQIMIRRFHLRFLIKLQDTTNPLNTTNTVRCLFVMDRQVNGATPAVSDILNISDWQSFNNLANSHRFRILSDKLYTINCTAGGYTGTSDIGFAKSMHGSISLPKMAQCPIEYSANTGVISEIRSCGFWFLVIAEKSISTTIEWASRWRFSDALHR